jgi:septal ring factor EnvC (AmiA/AmiB activator)
MVRYDEHNTQVHAAKGDSMGLGSTAKRIKQLGEHMEALYDQLSTLHERVQELDDTVDDFDDRLTAIEGSTERQERLLEALAEAEGIDVAAVLEASDEAAEDGQSS